MQAKELRTGSTIIHKGEIHTVTDYKFSNPGNKRAFVQLTIQGLKSGKIITEKFSSNETIEMASLDSRKCQFQYADQSGFHFMDLEDYNSFDLSEKVIGDQKFYLKENDEIVIDFYEGNPVNLELPKQVVLKLTESPPWVRGDSVSNNLKPAVAETGLKIQVPIFIKEGEEVRVDTKTGEYIGRK